MRKYWYMLKMALLDMFSDAGKTWIWMLVEASQAFVFAFTWLVVAGGREQLGPLRTGEVVAYYLFVFMAWFIVGGFFHFMMGDSIREGKLNLQLTKPILPFSREILSEQGWKLFGFITSLPLLGFLILAFSGNIEVNITLPNLLLTIPALILGGLIFGAIDFLIGAAGFWMDRVDGARGISIALNNVLGGYYIPFAFLPQSLQQIASLLPFRYTFSFPIELFQGQLQSADIIRGFIVQLVWAAVLLSFCRIALQAGLLRYEGFGG